LYRRQRNAAVGVENDVGSVRLVGAKAIIGIVLALVEIETATGAKAAQGGLASDVRPTAKVRETSGFAKTLTGGSLLAVRPKVSVRADAGGLRFAQCQTGAFSGAIKVEFLTGVLVTPISLPGSLANALLVGIGNGQFSAEVSRRARPVLSAIGIGTEVDFAVGSRKACFALTGLGAAIAIRVGIVAPPRTVTGAFGSFDDSRAIAV